MTDAAGSPFLRAPRSEWVAENDLAFALRDRYPVSPGHTLVVPKRVVPTWFDATPQEQHALLALVDVVKRDLDRGEPRPDGYNVGFNAGEAAGQTVMHLHVHVIPRFRGDMDDPRGGVRHVIPSKGNYLRSVPPLATGGEADPFARHVLPLFEVAEQVAIVAAFVQRSGLERVGPTLLRALERGAAVRLLTGDYLEITQVAALEQLLDWQSAAGIEDEDGEQRPTGRFEVRVVEVDRLPGATRSFHPKSWRFEGRQFGIAFVGSSNLSRAALDTGIEWNLRVDRDRDASAFRSVVAAFDDLWTRATPLDARFVDAYAQRVPARPQRLPIGDAEPEPTPTLPEPHPVQVEALARLRQSREDGRRRALVVLATGLGKTLLAALDYQQMLEEIGRRPRLLFLAHRRELLTQAAEAYRALFGVRHERATVGWCLGEMGELGADLVFASVAKLARKEQLARLRNERFDYVVVDEVHHAAADSYRRILDAVDPLFLLGLTATPDRADAADVLGLFDDHLAYQAGIERGIELGRLVPFHYFGVKDDIDYENIPWRNRRFDPEELAAAAQTEARMQTMWRAWNTQPGHRTLVFCCSIEHAAFVKRWLSERGVRVSAIFSGEGSDDRDGALQRLRDGSIDALCAVDVLNEGVDIPSVDRVVMLRPTDSGLLFLQQLGRGLRAPPEGSALEKSALTVIDFVGNHRFFLDRLRTLLALGSGGIEQLRALIQESGHAKLPAGCSVELELEAKEILSQLFRVGGTDEVERAYREIKVVRNERPTAGELLRLGYLPRKLRPRHDSWLDFVRSEGDLAAPEVDVLTAAGAFLRDLETTEMTKSFKMVTLQALLDHDALLSGMDLRELARRAHAILRRSPELMADLPETMRLDSFDASDPRWIDYWHKNPIAAWTGAKEGRRSWFGIEGDRFVLNQSIPSELADAFGRLVGEIVDYRLAQYRRRASAAGASTDGFVCRVTWNQRDPILKLPPREGGRVPEGEVEVCLVDGSVWVFRFAKEFCNVARSAVVQGNQLPDLLRRWFGPRAGQPGTAFRVRFRPGARRYCVEPEAAEATPAPASSRSAIVAYPDLRAATGHASETAAAPDAERALLPVEANDPDLFAVRVSGDWTDAGRLPLREGDWAVFRLVRSTPASSVQTRVAPVAVAAETAGASYITRVIEREGRWWLESDLPREPRQLAGRQMTIVARLEQAFRPEALAPEGLGDQGA